MAADVQGGLENNLAEHFQSSFKLCRNVGG